MRTIAIMNLKGGVGKTVTAINLASILANDHKKRVLVVDADSQCNATEFLLEDGEEPLGTLTDLLRNNGSGTFCITNTGERNVSIIPADDNLMALDLRMVEGKRLHLCALRDALADIDVANLYDYVIIDCPPAFSVACAAALIAAQDVIVPIKLDAFSLRGMTNLYRQIANMRRINQTLRVAGCLVTMWYKSKELEQAEQELRRSILPIFETKIRRSDRVDGMTFAQEPLRCYSPRSSAGIDYRRFVRELIGGVGRG